MWLQVDAAVTMAVAATVRPAFMVEVVIVMAVAAMCIDIDITHHTTGALCTLESIRQIAGLDSVAWASSWSCIVLQYLDSDTPTLLIAHHAHSTRFKRCI